MPFREAYGASPVGVNAREFLAVAVLNRDFPMAVLAATVAREAGRYRHRPILYFSLFNLFYHGTAPFCTDRRNRTSIYSVRIYRFTVDEELITELVQPETANQ